MRIEKMTESYIDEIYDIEKSCFTNPWIKQGFVEELENDTSLFLVALEDDKVIGYIGMSIVIDEGYLFNVAVKKEKRNKGVATALINEFVTYGKKHNFCFLSLEVRESNSSAISLYSKFGFIEVGKRLNYYSNPLDNALLMTKYF